MMYDCMTLVILHDKWSRCLLGSTNKISGFCASVRGVALGRNVVKIPHSPQLALLDSCFASFCVDTSKVFNCGACVLCNDCLFRFFSVLSSI